MKKHIGIIGFGSMSQNITINLIKKKIKISIFNKEKIKINLKIFNIIIITNCLKKFIKSLSLTKIIFLLIKTGNPIKILILKLKKKLSKDDIVIDFGNSFFKDTIINNKILNKKYLFLSSGISGGYLGALNGLCCMIDIKISQYKNIYPIISNIFFIKNNRFSCCLTLGFSSSHYIKMIHNGIEYGILQLISEIFFILKIFLKKKKIIINFLLELNKTNLCCYLLKILINILFKKKKKISDIIEHKGTGLNSVLNSIKNNINTSSIFEALIIRILSKKILIRNFIFLNNNIFIFLNLSLFLEILKNTFFFCKLLCYIQGFNQIIKIFKKYNWKINFNNLIKSYLNSCIIDSNILYYLINFKKNFFFIKIFFSCIKKIIFIRKLIFISLNCNFIISFINSCYNFFLLIIYKNYNFKLIQFERNYFGNHILKFI